MHIAELHGPASRVRARSLRISIPVLPLLVTAALGGCADHPLDPADGTGVRIVIAGTDPARAVGGGSVEPAVAVVEVGATVQLLALDDRGAELRARWSSSEASVAAVSSTGLVTGLGEGVATITSVASGNRGSASAVVHVVPARAATARACSDLPRLRTVPVASATALGSALAGAEPGDLIELAPGVYTGFFKATRSGTPEHRITVCGPREAVLQTGAVDRGHAFWIDGASHWTLQGFTAGTALGGISITGGHHNHVVGVLVRNTGLHGIRIGLHSSHSVVRASEIRETGRVDPEFGEGIYVGSWSGSWCARTDCQPDRSDSTLIVDNRIGPDVTAEHVQVMEGTTGGLIRGNVFDGRGMGAPGAPHVDSWVAVMGNGYRVEENRGTVSLRNGFEVWVEREGWGRDNVFHRNVADVRAGGYGFHVSASASGTVISCDNVVLDARAGFANVACR
jgi:hypothetical protein